MANTNKGYPANFQKWPTIGAIRRDRIAGGEKAAREGPDEGDQSIAIIEAARTVAQEETPENTEAPSRSSTAVVEGIIGRMVFERRYPLPEEYEQQLWAADRMDPTAPTFWTRSKMEKAVEEFVEMRKVIAPAFEALGKDDQTKESLNRLESAYIRHGDAASQEQRSKAVADELAKILSGE